jgi:8-oxo-(d)GTP phosphatase
MKIYIDNVVLRFQQNNSKPEGTELSLLNALEGLSELKSSYYRIVDFERNLFLEGLPKLLSSRPNHKVHFNIILNEDFSPYEEIINEYEAEPAAGGLVMKNSKFLMIKRLGKWDLPKGKLEKGETTEDAALREVNEECGIKAQSKGHICDTHHMYMRKGRVFIKKTAWYLMHNIDDSKMNGQEEEGITEVNWFSRKMLETNLIHSYGNIEDVFLNYLKLSDSKADKEGTH